MPFFHFSQNNTGGIFHFDDKVTHHVVIEADTPKLANRLAEEIGLYFNGVIAGRDCSCCGSRWQTQFDGEKGDDLPMVYGIPVDEAKPGHNWDNNELDKVNKNGPDILVYWKNVLEPEGFLY